MSEAVHVALHIFVCNVALNTQFEAQFCYICLFLDSDRCIMNGNCRASQEKTATAVCTRKSHVEAATEHSMIAININNSDTVFRILDVQV
jgi:hypothetical protein